MKTPLWLAGLAGSIAAAIYVEWHTDEVTVVLAVLVLCGAALGAAKPPLAPVAGIALGFSIVAAHGVTETLGRFRPPYMHHAPRPGDWAAMALAGVAVTVVAWSAGLVRTRLRES